MRVCRHLIIIIIGLLLWWAGAWAQTPRPDASFTIFFRQAPVGNEQVTLSRRPDGFVITASGRFGAPLNFVARRMEMRYDTAWRPQELVIEATQANQPTSLRTTFAGSSATSELRLAGEMTRETDQISADTVVLHTSFFGTYEALAARLASVQVGGTVPVYMAPQSEIPARLDAISTERVQTAKRIVEAKRYRLTLLSPGAPIAAEVWAESDTNRLLRITMPNASLDVVREDFAAVSARRVVVTHPGDEDVRVLASGFNLAGTLTKPAAAAAPSAAPGARARTVTRSPAVVLVPGSGVQDRDLMLGDVPVFGQLAGALADAGYVVLRYDKRGIGQSGGRVETTTFADYAEDLRAVVRFLAKRKDVDERRIAVAGHDEGGWITLLAASREKKVAAAVLLASPGTSGVELVLEQQRATLERMNIPEAERQAKVDLQRKINDAVLSGKGWEYIPPEIREQADSAWFQSFLAFDPAKVMGRVRQPVLIVHGERDVHLSPQHADKLAALAAARKKALPAEVAKLPQVDHQLLPANGGQPPKSVSPEVVSTITKWLDKWLAPRQ